MTGRTIRRIILTTLAAATPLACTRTQPTPVAPPVGTVHNPQDRGEGSSAAAGDEPDYQLIIRLAMTAIEVPMGTASASENLWSYLDEEALGQQRAVAFGLNGVRLGHGRREYWADFADRLGQLTGQQFQAGQTVALPGMPVQIPLRHALPGETLFLFHGDRTLTGQDVPAGDALLTVVMTLDHNDPTRVLLTGRFQIRDRRVRSEVAHNPGEPFVRARQDLYPLEPMDWQMFVPSGDFLVIGPGRESRRAHSAGRYLLLHQKQGVGFETVLVLVPEVFREPRSVIRPQAIGWTP